MSRDHVLVATDFDGVIAPLVGTPNLAVPDSRAVAILTDLAGRDDVDVAVISGRARQDLSIRLGNVPHAILVGEHGNDAGQAVATPRVLHDAHDLIRRLHDLLPAATVETKPRSVTFHTRALGREQKSAARRAITEWANGREGISLLEGKEVYELTVGMRTKGDAIVDLAEAADGTIYFGDDMTDETVFERLGPGDIGVKVGQGGTLARYRVADVAGVVEVLEWITSNAVDRGGNDTGG